MRANPEPRSIAGGSDYNNDDNGNGNGSAAASSSSQEGGQGQQQQDQTQQQGRGIFRRLTILPSFTPSSSAPGRMIGSNDGVFANLAAKPERGEKNEDLPPVGLFVIIFLYSLGALLIHDSPTKKQPPMRRRRTGKLLSWRQASRPMRCSWMDCRLGRSSPLSGTP